MKKSRKRRLKKKILSLFVSLSLMTSVLTINASADADTLRVNFYVSDSYLSKNGVPNATTTYLNTNFNKVRNAYLGIAGIHLVKETFNYSSSTIITTPADTCSYTSGSNYNNYCSHNISSCSNSNSNHHTNAVYIKNTLLPAGSLSTHANCLLVSHRICWINPNTNTHGYLVGVAEKGNHRFVLRDEIKTADDGTEYSLFPEVMAHEIGHLYNVVDHYTGTDPHPNCIWGTNRHKKAVATHLTMCTTCCSTLNTYKSKYNQ